MQNPFELLEAKLSNIERLLIDLKLKPEVHPGSGEEEPLNVEQAANFLDLEPSTIYAKVQAGEIPHSRKGKRLYFFRSELLEYLKGGRKQTNAEIEAEAHTNITRKR